MEHKFTKKEQVQAIKKVVDLINKYKLTMDIVHQINIIPMMSEVNNEPKTKNEEENK